MPLKLSKKELRYALYGLILGDGSLDTHSRLKIGHSVPHQEYYVEFLRMFFEENGIPYSNWVQRGSNPLKENYQSEYISVSLSKFSGIKDEFIFSGEKVITAKVASRITPLGLLFLYLDDGSLDVYKKYKKDRSLNDDGSYRYTTGRSAYLNLHGFSSNEQNTLRKYLKSRFDIETSLHTDSSGIYKGRGHKRIYINAENFRKFYDLVRPYLPYIPKDFKYKFDMKYKEESWVKKQREFIKYNGLEVGRDYPEKHESLQTNVG